MGTRRQQMGRRWRGRSWLVAAAAMTLLVSGVVPAAAAAKPSREGGMRVAEGTSWVTTTSVTVDSAVPQASTMRIFNVDGSWSDWMPYTAVASWTLVPGDGQKTVRVQYRIAGGHPVTFSDGVLLDTTAPTTTIVSESPATSTVALGLVATDVLSGVASTCYRVDGGAWQSGGSVTLALLIPHKRTGYAAGAHTVDFFSTDEAGNGEPVQSLVVTLGG